MKNFTSLNKLPNTRAFVAVENGSVEVLELVAPFLLKTGTFGAKKWLEISVDAISCYVEIFFRTERGKYTETLFILSAFSIKLFLLYCELYSPEVSDYSVSCN